MTFLGMGWAKFLIFTGIKNRWNINISKMVENCFVNWKGVEKINVFHQETVFVQESCVATILDCSV